MDDAVQNVTIAYNYDSHGNITSKATYDYTTAPDLTGLTPSSTIKYKYGNSAFPDEMTSYNDGYTLIYDDLGNPLNYIGWNMTWTAGRELNSMTNDSDNLSYQYDDNGIRTSKTVNGVKTTYTTVDGRITSQTDGTDTMYYRYDKNNQLVGFNLNGTEYVYVMNGQGDVTGILDTTGKQIVSYTYDAWGKCTIASDTSGKNIGSINPMRYRGYYLDKETGFFYVGSRYYDPNTCRFLNTDEPSMLGLNVDSPISANLFAYCGNNPVMRIDPTGYAWWNTALNYLRSRDFVSGVINFALSLLLGGAIGGGLISMLKKRAARYGREATKTYLSYELRRKLKKAALKETTKVMILVGVIKLVDLASNILDPGGWIFDTFLDKDGNRIID